MTNPEIKKDEEAGETKLWQRVECWLGMAVGIGLVGIAWANRHKILEWFK